MCALDHEYYVLLNDHKSLKGEVCAPHPYNVVTGAKRPIRGLRADQVPDSGTGILEKLALAICSKAN